MLDKIRNFVVGVKAVATSVVAKLAVVGVVLTAVVAALTPLAPTVPLVGLALPYLVAAVGFVGTVTAIVRRVAEVPTDIVGLQPVSNEDKAIAFAAESSWDVNDDEWGQFVSHDSFPDGV